MIIYIRLTWGDIMEFKEKNIKMQNIENEVNNIFSILTKENNLTLEDLDKLFSKNVELKNKYLIQMKSRAEDLYFNFSESENKVRNNSILAFLLVLANLGIVIFNPGSFLLSAITLYLLLKKISRSNKKINSKKDYKNEEFNLDNIEKQLEIIDVLGRCKKVIEARKQELVELDSLTKARFVEMFGDPRSNPFGFEKKRLKDTCKVITGNTPSRAIEEYYGDYIEWIKTDNIVSGILNPTQATESLSEKGMNVGRTVEKDSILMACIAGSIASIGRVCITDRTVAFNQQINAVVPEQYNILFLYVLFQMSKDYLVEDINMALKGILSKSKLEEKEFIIPPMDLQEQFSDFVKQVDKSKFDTMTFAPIYAIINLYLHTYFYQGRR